jgi:hypothetical protein
MTKKTPAKKTNKNVKEVWVRVNDSTQIRIEVSEFKEQYRLDIREYIETERYTGFTKKGVNVLTNYAEELYEALGKIVETIKAENLINELEEETEEGA